MIALRDSMPLIATPTGQASSFDKLWIATSLRSAAKKAGYKRWSLASDITESVALYLQHEIEAFSVDVFELEKIVSDLLESLGYNDIASQFFLPDPPIKISLMDLAEKAGTNYELLFFKLLKKRLQEITQSNADRLKISDLEPCLYYLTHRTRVGRAKILREEIINCIRHYSGTRNPGGADGHLQPLAIELS